MLAQKHLYIQRVRSIALSLVRGPAPKMSRLKHDTAEECLETLVEGVDTITKQYRKELWGAEEMLPGQASEKDQNPLGRISKVSGVS